MKSLDDFSSFVRKDKTISRKDNRNAVVYTRVSTKEQAETNLSLNTQKKYCEEYARKEGLMVLEFFGGTYESAQTDERIQFKNMLAFVKKRNIAHIIVYSIDRFSRSGANAIATIEDLNKKGISVLSVTQPTETGTPMGSFFQNIHLLFSQYDNELRRSKCVAGMKERLKLGYWIGKAPLGYSHVHDESNRPVVVINEAGKLLKKAFLWKVQERITNTEIIRRLKALGLGVTKQRLTEVFRNPFYCGVVAHGLLDDPMKGLHEPLISHELFLKANQIIKKLPHDYKHQVVNDELPLKRFVKCSKCSAPFTGYFVKQKKKHYYKCNNTECRTNVSKEKIHERFMQVLSGFRLQEKWIAPLKKQLSYVVEDSCKVDTGEYAVLRKRLNEMEQKTQKVKERFAIGELDKSLYKQCISKFSDEKDAITKAINALSSSSHIDDCMTYATEVAQDLSKLWDIGNYEYKRSLQFFLFPKGVSYSKESESFSLSEVNPMCIKYYAD